MTTTVIVTEGSTYTVVLSEVTHVHDSRYYTEAEIDALLLDGTVNINETLGTDLSYSGPTSTITVGEDVVFGDFLYKNLVDEKYYKAQANAILTSPAIRMALATAVADATCLVLCPGGITRNDAWNWTDDGTCIALYLSAAVAGDVTEVPDTTTNNIGQIVAIPTASNKIEFRPSMNIARF